MRRCGRKAWSWGGASCALALMLLVPGFAMADDGETVLAGLSGRVSDAVTAESITCATVLLSPADGGNPVVATADANGKYFFEPLPPGLYSVRVMAPGYEDLLPPAAIEGDALTVRNFALTPRSGPVIHGQATSLGLGLGLPGASIELKLADGTPVGDTFACADGRYEISLASLVGMGPVLPFELVANMPAYRTLVVVFSANPAQGVAVDLELETFGGTSVPAALAGSITGLTADGPVPVPGARLTLRGPIALGLDPDAEGLYAINPLLAGRYTITASAPRFRAQTILRTLAQSEFGEASFQLVPFPDADINGDGRVDAVDVQLIINAVLGIVLAQSFQADINGDGTVDAVDVQQVINAALGADS